MSYTTPVDAKPRRLKSFQTSNGGRERREVEAAIALRCPTDHMWLLGVLKQNGLVAYNPTISVTDPKQRRLANEVSDW